MKSLILTKSYPNIQFAHLYEHLFVMELKSHFRDSRLYKDLDYTLRGTAFDSNGMIVLEITLFSEEALQTIDEIRKLPLNFGNDNINVTKALQQISAEEDGALYISDKSLLLNELQKLHEQNWQSAENIDLIDTQNSAITDEPIYITDEPHPAPEKIFLEYSLDGDFAQSNHQLLPLFSVFSAWIIANALDILADSRGYYAYKIEWRAETNGKLGTLLAEDGLSSSISLRSDLDYLTNELHKMLSEKTLQYFTDQLSTCSYSDPANQPPDLDRLENETGLLVGEEYWQKVASLENIESLLNHSTLTLSNKKGKVSNKLS